MLLADIWAFGALLESKTICDDLLGATAIGITGSTAILDKYKYAPTRIMAAASTRKSHFFVVIVMPNSKESALNCFEKVFTLTPLN